MVFAADILSGAPLRKRLCFQFAVLANEAGFPVEASAYARDSSPLGMRSLGAVGEKEDVGNIGAMALAQHHGIPTRLLDWSVNPMTAAFFAASPPFRPEGSKSICVWALNRHDVQRPKDKQYPQRQLHVVVHEPPRGNNRYLHAQGGIFTEVTAVQRFFFQNNRWPSLENVFSEEAATEPTQLIRHCLNSDEVPR